MRKTIFVCDACEKQKEWNENCSILVENNRTIELCSECTAAYQKEKKKLAADITAINQEAQNLIKEKKYAFEEKWILGKGTFCNGNASDSDFYKLCRKFYNI